MTRAHIEVVVVMSLEEAEGLRNHLDRNVKSGSGDILIDVYNGLNDALKLAKKALA